MNKIHGWRGFEQRVLHGLWRLMRRKWEEPLSYQRTLKGVMRQVVKRITGIYWVGGTLFEHDLVKLPIPTPSAKVPVEVMVGSQTDIPRFKGLVPDIKLEQFAQRLSEGKVWLFVTIDDEVAYSTWISFEDLYDTNTKTWVRVAPTGALLLDSFTVPRYRGLGLHTIMTARRLSIAKEHGAERALVIVIDGNVAAWKVQEKLGACKVEHILTVTVWGRSFTRRSPYNESR